MRPRAGSTAAAGLALAAALAAGRTAALEPRFDHRDQQGPTLELQWANDVVAPPRRASGSAAGPALRLGWGLDLAGEGNELVVGLRATLPRPDPLRVHLRLALDVRYRAYFGTEELKTFLDAGILAPVASRLAAGPLLGLGVQYDPSRSAGLFLGAMVATGFGEARVTSVGLAGGAQLRF
ncbi:MAG: hypothetical protein QM704_18080 [Anaeromyxobacteraceae bacterium]